jgi:ATP-dependent Clp protease ATP-binding subunit ClpA
LDKAVVFRSLRREQLEEVLEIELGMVQRRVLEKENRRFLFRVTASGREFLLLEGTDQRYGARHLKRAIEAHVVYPLANLLATEQVKLDDMLCIDWDERTGHLVFWKEQAVRPLPVPQRQPERGQVRGAASGLTVKTLHRPAAGSS